MNKYLEWKEKRVWYDIRRVWSYNALYNFIIGMRNSGKTYSLKVKVVDLFMKKGYTFIWLRRQVNESQQAVKGFFDAIIKDKYLQQKYGEIKYMVRGNQLFINGVLCGEVLALAQHQVYKSREFPSVHTIVFDEFIAEGTRKTYLNDEADVLNGIVLTIKRHKPDMRVFMLGNSVKFNNPYMNHFKIKPFKNGIRHYKKIGVLVEMYINKYMIIKMMSSDFGRLIAGTDYFDFAILNQFKDGHEKFIERKPLSAEYHCSIKYEGQIFSFYYEREHNVMYTVRNSVEDKRKLIVLSEQDHDIDYQLVKNIKRTRMMKVINYYQMGMLRFNDTTIRETVLLTLTLI